METDLNMRLRAVLPESRRIIVKIGTRVIEHESGKPDKSKIKSLVHQVSNLVSAGYQVVMVSSGAIGAGMDLLGINERPKEVPDLQMCAAVGQARIISLYEKFFTAQGVCIGQVLLTHDDFDDQIRTGNVKRTLEHLLRAGVVPIVNENDVVADEEIKAYLSLGDNDYLSALVVKLIRADLLVILSTVNGVMRMNRKVKTRIKYIEKIDDDILELVNPPKAGGISKGGMDSKLRSASIATKSGANVVITDGRKPDALLDVLAGADIGTIIPGATI